MEKQAETSSQFCLSRFPTNDRQYKQVVFQLNKLYKFQSKKCPCSVYEEQRKQFQIFMQLFWNITIAIIFCMDKFISQVIQPLLSNPIPSNQLSDKLSLLETELKIFLNTQVKIELGNVNKELTKKSRQLFILSSDNQSLKQALEQSQGSLQNCKYQINQLEQQKVKQKMLTDRQIQILNKKIEMQQKQSKRETQRLKMQKDIVEENYKAKIRDIKNDHQQQINKVIDEQRSAFEVEKQSINAQFDEQKNTIFKENADKVKSMIRKYEDKIAKLASDYEDQIFLINKQFSQYKKQTKENKNSLQSKIAGLESNLSRCQFDLTKEIQSHRKYLSLYNSTYASLTESQQNSLKEKQKLENEIHEGKKLLSQQERKLTTEIKQLKTLLETTIREKDKKYNDTFETMQTEFRIKYESLETRLIQQKQMAVTQVEVKRDQQNNAHQIKIQMLNEELGSLKIQYTEVSNEYERKIKDLHQEHQDNLDNINLRRQYEITVNGRNSDREFNALKNKYELEIKAIYNEHSKHLEQVAKKHQEDKIGLTNKLTTQYESMINDQKISNEIQLKQKLIEFDRKAKSYEAKLKDAQKKRNQLKIAAERAKMEMQMRIDSMLQLNQFYESQISNLNLKIQENQREKQKIVNEYELKILLIKNQMKATRQQFQQREAQLKDLLQRKLTTKNNEISLLLTKVKKQTQALIQANEKRVNALEKQYSELKRVMGQKTSLPEDIEALKVFHGAYLEKEKQLLDEKQKVQFLYRQLRAKDAMDKIFAQKGTKKVLIPVHPSLPNTLLSFKSHQI